MAPNNLIKNPFRSLCLLYAFWCGVSFYALASEPGLGLPTTRELQGGWYNVEPYFYQKEENGIKVLQGLDFEFMKLASKNLEQEIEYKEVSWDKLLQEIAAGKKDFATGALFSKERAYYAYYSIPYRYEEESLFVQKNKSQNLEFQNTEELLNYIKKSQFKLGVVKGFIYADPLINQYIKNPSHQAWIIKKDNNDEVMSSLLKNEIDGFITDRIVGMTVICRMQARKDIIEYPLQGRSPVHIIFSKKTVSPEVVEKYNKVITTLHTKKEYQKIVYWYLYPTLFLQTENLEWFKFTEMIGIVAFAISGLIIACKEKTTLLGALILAILPSLGGGLIRDIIVGRNPVGLLRSPLYLFYVLLTVLIGFIAIKLFEYVKRKYKISQEIETLLWKEAGHLLIITDAIGLAVFSVKGVIVSLSAKLDPLWLWGPCFAFLTGAGGSILRDVLSRSRYITALEGELYGELAILGGLLLSLFIIFSAADARPEYIPYSVIVAVLGIFVARLIAHFWRIPNARFQYDIQ